VRKFTYPGKTCEEIAECIDSIFVNDDPSQVIIHCGTNNLTTDQAEVCVDKIKNLVGKVKTKFPNSSIGVSSLTYREDINVDFIRVKVNDQLNRLAHEITFSLLIILSLIVLV
jgi:sialic acid synthase SpsE